MADLCDVCAAKRGRTTVPKRKCTCDSGQTQHRNRNVARKRIEHLAQFQEDHDPLEHLFDLEEYEEGLVRKSEDGKFILQTCISLPYLYTEA